MARKKVIIIGGGFGGLRVAQSLKRADVEVMLVDRSNHHLFQPLLYQVAGAVLSVGDIACPIREVLRRQENTSVVLASVHAIDKKTKQVIFANGEKHSYDTLIVAVGARHSYFGHDAWEKYAPGLKTLEDALKIRERILLAFEKAERLSDQEEIADHLRFVIIGGGPTGVEMAGSIAEITHKTLFRNFRHIQPEHSEILLIEGMERILPPFSEALSKRAQDDLEKMGVQVLTKTFVTDITEEGVAVGDSFIKSRNVIWAAGNQASPLLKTLDVPQDKQGRVLVDSDLTIADHPEIFVIGDAAHALDNEGHPLPGLAPVAMQQGDYVADLISQETPKSERIPFRYYDKGTMATIGKAKAVAQIGKWSFTGFFAWLMWSFVHIFSLISFRTKLSVMFSWCYLLLTGRRQVRIVIPTAEKSLQKADIQGGTLGSENYHESTL